mgnify:CR=1 FL=1
MSTKALSVTFDLLVKLLECGHLPKGAQQRPTKQDVLGISRVTSKAPRWRVTTWESCGPRVGASCLRRGPERRACIGHRRRAYAYCVDAITVTRRWSRLVGAPLIVREGRDAIAVTDASVTVSTQRRYYCRSRLSRGNRTCGPESRQGVQRRARTLRIPGAEGHDARARVHAQPQRHARQVFSCSFASSAIGGTK